jgi:aminoglycoside phosphotransferase (APT) family kinase protein
MAFLAARDAGAGMKVAPPPELAGQVEAIAAELGLAGWQVTLLPGGEANRTLRLQDASHDLVLRVAGAMSAALGANGASESAMQALAAGAGLAPDVVLARPGAGLLVTRHAAGRAIPREQMHEPTTLARIGRWIAALQALPLPPGLPCVDLAGRAAGYLGRLGSRAASAPVDELTRRLERRRAALAPAPAVCCHHDLYHRNFIDAADGLLAVDWEYAGPGDPAADLASCIHYHDLGPRETDALLAGYGTDDAALRVRVATLGWIFDCLWFGWNAVAGLEGLPPQPALQTRLAARLLA